eukprot:COSAG01_NODE_9568_length_2407_cov_1.781196_2_plen_91_part_00
MLLQVHIWEAKREQNGRRRLLLASVPPRGPTAQIWRPATGKKVGGMDMFDLQDMYRRDVSSHPTKTLERQVCLVHEPTVLLLLLRLLTAL